VGIGAAMLPGVSRPGGMPPVRDRIHDSEEMASAINHVQHQFSAKCRNSVVSRIITFYRAARSRRAWAAWSRNCARRGLRWRCGVIARSAVFADFGAFLQSGWGVAERAQIPLGIGDIRLIRGNGFADR
jgi:hypothetical protein